MAGEGSWKIRKYIVGRTDYRKLKDVKLVSNPSQHTLYHTLGVFVEVMLTLYVLFFLVPEFLPQMIRAEGTTEIGFIYDMFPGFLAVFVITSISVIIQLKIRYDIIHQLPRKFDYWKIKRLFQWELFGFESLKVWFIRFFKKEDRDYPELGMGSDEEGNYYAFVVPAKDVSLYRTI